MTNDLIRRGALLEKAVWVVEYDESGCGFDMKAVPIEDVLKAPAAYAVEVCRCKDCKHAGKHEAVFFPGHIPCGLRMQPTIVKPDDFCSYGERRADK